MSRPIRDLAGDFPAFGPDDWTALAQAAIGERDFARTLVRRTPGGIERGPVFFDRPASRPGTALPDQTNPHLPWAIQQDFAGGDLPSANAAILEDLAGGVSQIGLRLDHSGEAGLAIRTAAEAAELLDGVDLALAPVFLSPRTTRDEAEPFLSLIQDAASRGPSLRGGLGLAPGDPAGFALAAELGETLDHVEILHIDARVVHDSCGTEIHELAFAASALNCAMRGLLDAGLSPDRAASRIGLTLAADADIHAGIAKFRAARRIWAAILDAFRVSPARQRGRIHAVTSFRMLSANDPWTNLVRNAAAGFAAGCASVDGLTVRPLTDALGRPAAFGRRLARNLQILLQEESHIGRVADPAGGSYLHETLTDRMAEAAWARFQTLESEGGFASALSDGPFRDEIAAARDALIEAHATGSEALIGVSNFVPAENRPVLSADTNWQACLPRSPFAAFRVAAPFEALADLGNAAPDEKRTVFLATLGDLADFNARATFASRRLAVGGLRAAGGDIHASLDAMVAAFKASPARLAILCGSDEAYARSADRAAAMLREAGARAVWLAGAPNPAFGNIDHFIHLRSHVIEDIRSAFEALEIAS